MNEEVPQSGASSFFCVRERKVIMSSGWLSVAEIFEQCITLPLWKKFDGMVHDFFYKITLEDVLNGNI